MESYVEIAFIHNFLTNVISVWMALYLIQKPLRGRRVIAYAFLSSFWSSFVFHDAGWIVLFMIEAVSFTFVFYRQKALYLAALMFRWLWHATCFVLWEGSFHLGAFFPWVHTPIYFCWFLYAALFLYLYTHASTLMKQRFIYGCTIYADEPVHLRGYMDSGNFVSWNHLPVVFVCAEQRDRFKGKSCEIRVQSIHGCQRMKAMLIYCAIDGCAKQKAYAVFVSGLSIRGGCQMILNLKMLSMR